MTKNQSVTITKKVAKHGRQTIIVIPTVLSNIIRHGMLVRVTIDILENKEFIEELK
ncbi:hypothetical protein KA107_02605 [Candidatus Pacearchaeota archaeon]|nr:hypothetical protein [Candidatus Pacearchaeota archaeon]